MSSYNSQVLRSGAYAYSVNYPSAFSSADAAVNMALVAKLAGLFVKCSDGTSTSYTATPPANWMANLESITPAAQSAGLDVIPWAVVYPDDSSPTNAQAISNIAHAVDVTGASAVLLEPYMSEFNSSPTSAGPLLVAIQNAVPNTKLLYCTWGDPKVLPTFPYDTFNRICAATLPELYYTSYVVEYKNAAGIWNQYWDWILNNPAFNGIPVIPTFDTNAVGSFISLAKNEGAPTISWWFLEAPLMPAIASVLAASPYAVVVSPKAVSEGDTEASTPATSTPTTAALSMSTATTTTTTVTSTSATSTVVSAETIAEVKSLLQKAVDLL